MFIINTTYLDKDFNLVKGDINSGVRAHPAPQG